MSNIKAIGAYQKYVEKLTNGTLTVVDTKQQIINRYSNLFNKYSLRTSDGVFIKDPSQNNQIVSEGQAYWQLLSVGLARIDTANARKYQNDFDALLKGTQYMIKLAKDAGNGGEFPAWKVKQSGGTVVLDKDQYGPTANSASDADIDSVRSLIYAQELVERGIWVDRGYNKLLDKLIPAAQNLFRDQNGLRVLRPSEDWDGFHFTDYLDPAAYKEIAAYLAKHKKPNAAFWEKAANDSIALYGEILNDTKTFPAHINITRGNATTSPWLPNTDVKAANNTVMTYDGIRSPWRIARYIILYPETSKEARVACEAIVHGQNNNFRHTSSVEMDAAMYLPLSVALGHSSATELAKRVLNGISADKYYENTLILLGLVDTLYPRQVNINNVKP